MEATEPQAKPDLLDEKAIVEIEARANAATAGPWNPSQRNPDCQVVTVPSIGVEGELIANCPKGDDTWFIAHARTDIHALCQTVRALYNERVGHVLITEVDNETYDRLVHILLDEDREPASSTLDADDILKQIIADRDALRERLASVENERELCLQVQKRGEHSSVTCACIAALEQ